MGAPNVSNSKEKNCFCLSGKANLHDLLHNPQLQSELYISRSLFINFKIKPWGFRTEYNVIERHIYIKVWLPWFIEFENWYSNGSSIWFIKLINCSAPETVLQILPFKLIYKRKTVTTRTQTHVMNKNEQMIEENE